jgi:hypothetical protein
MVTLPARKCPDCGKVAMYRGDEDGNNVEIWCRYCKKSISSLQPLTSEDTTTENDESDHNKN